MILCVREVCGNLLWSTAGNFKYQNMRRQNWTRHGQQNAQMNGSSRLKVTYLQHESIEGLIRVFHSGLADTPVTLHMGRLRRTSVVSLVTTRDLCRLKSREETEL